MWLVSSHHGRKYRQSNHQSGNHRYFFRVPVRVRRNIWKLWHCRIPGPFTPARMICRTCRSRAIRSRPCSSTPMDGSSPASAQPRPFKPRRVHFRFRPGLRIRRRHSELDVWLVSTAPPHLSNQGTISFDRATTAVGVRDFTQPIFPTVGEAYTTLHDFTGANDPLATTVGTVDAFIPYSSIRPTTVPEPASLQRSSWVCPDRRSSPPPLTVFRR